MDHWATFYERVFNFREIRHFDIKGEYSGLASRAMTAPDNKIRIPLNEEAAAGGGQIDEFLDAGGGNVLAFFELPHQPDMARDPNTPEWVQHIAFKVADKPALLAAKAHIEAEGIAVLGPTWHGVFESIYCFDPNGTASN